MLTTLHIENIAVIEKTDIEFSIVIFTCRILRGLTVTQRFLKNLTPAEHHHSAQQQRQKGKSFQIHQKFSKKTE